MKNIESFPFASLPWANMVVNSLAWSACLALIFFLAPCAMAATVVNVKAQQRPKSNIVDVYYDLIEEDGGLFDVALSIEGGGDKPDIQTVEGDAGIDITPGRNKHIEWDAGTDWPNKVQSNFVATVTAMPSVGMVLIPGGANSGSDPTFGAYSLSVGSFYMDRTEVSYLRWKAVYDWAVKHGYAFDTNFGGKGMNHPVHRVTWYDCVKWCNAKSEMNKRQPVYRVGGEVYRSGTAEPSANFGCDGYRLPTNEEWEYAARGGRRGLNFPWGNVINHNRANYCNQGMWYPEIEYSQASRLYHPSYSSGGYPYTAPIASFPPNDYGLYDMIGNVREWTGSAASDSTKYVRGGTWGSNGKICCLGNRTSESPGTTNYSTGFRTVRRP